MMTFEEWLKDTGLSSSAQHHLPQSLSEKSMRGLMCRPDGEQILVDAIEEINHGSIKTIEKLVERRLRK